MIFKGPATNSTEAADVRREYLEYLAEILHDIGHPPTDSGWRPTISLDLDYQTSKLFRPVVEIRVRVDPRLLSYWEWDYSYEPVLERTKLSEQPLCYAQLFTRGVADHSILDLVAVAGKYHVVAYGPAKLADLHLRWGLNPLQFSALAAPDWPKERPNGTISTDPILPALQTFRQRHEILRRLLAIPSARPKLYLFEAGTVSQWLISRLWDADPSGRMLDMGRTLELWYPDHAWPLKRSTRQLYRRASHAYYGARRYSELVSLVK